MVKVKCGFAPKEEIMNGGIAFKTSGDMSFLLLRAISSPTNTHQPRCFGAGLTHVKLTQPYIPGISLKFKMTERSEVAKTLALATGEGGARSPRPLPFILILAVRAA